jgi:hypothetical protein
MQVFGYFLTLCPTILLQREITHVHCRVMSSVWQSNGTVGLGEKSSNGTGELGNEMLKISHIWITSVSSSQSTCYVVLL